MKKMKVGTQMNGAFCALYRVAENIKIDKQLQFLRKKDMVLCDLSLKFGKIHWHVCMKAAAGGSKCE